MQFDQEIIDCPDDPGATYTVNGVTSPLSVASVLADAMSFAFDGPTPAGELTAFDMTNPNAIIWANPDVAPPALPIPAPNPTYTIVTIAKTDTTIVRVTFDSDIDPEAGISDGQPTLTKAGTDYPSTGGATGSDYLDIDFNTTITAGNTLRFKKPLAVIFVEAGNLNDDATHPVTVPP